MQYKLIEHPTLKKEFIVVSNEKVKVKDFVLTCDGITTYMYERNDTSGMARDGHFYNFISDGCIKIIASTVNITNTKGEEYSNFIPLIRKEQLNFNEEKVFILANKAINGGQELPKSLIEYRCAAVDFAFDKYVQGYNKHAETHPYTEEDLRNLLKYQHTYYTTEGLDNIGTSAFKQDEQILQEYLQSLKQPKEYMVTLESVYTSMGAKIAKRMIFLGFIGLLYNVITLPPYNEIKYHLYADFLAYGGVFLWLI